MTEKKVSDQHHTTFDGIRHLDEAGNEFWQARGRSPKRPTMRCTHEHGLCGQRTYDFTAPRRPKEK